MTKMKWFYALVTVLLLMHGNLFAQQRCMFVSTSADAPDSRDVPLIDTVTSWGYDVAVVGESSLATMTPDDFAEYDFAFISETINSSSAAPLKGHPLPLLIIEAWAIGKPTVLNWTATQSVSNVGPLDIIIMDETGHQLAAGLTTGTTFQLATGTISTNPEEVEIKFVPTIDVITIATFLDDDTQMSVCGAEEGTLLADEATVTANRASVIGIHANAYEFITDEAYQLMQAGIHWILHEETGVEWQKDKTPGQFALSQNFPNPFNPSTEITFSLLRPGHTTLIVFNALGKKVETLVDGRLSDGVYKVSFDAADLPAGVYFYELKSGAFTQMKKMVLIK